ncbi:glycosyltransferase [Bacteroides ovatus]|uniref:glycosyltransferase n=1 Tax=Bacteroides ovatus TaxID=28116 RepID=UPI001897B8F1|nr:glycosyltransferase [Bacteroides ovatus]MDC2622706.1 glycosyltransferase [Bacteroides ovatus]MDC2636542.1 glycosyltransferase [Bacteroides ovatus]MDC2651597.1 glycosyltransferase [Bacteroides ovatus]
MSKDNPLVSVVIITYNSVSTIIETLESIKQQTYRKIELIISDDCSTDNTRDVCNEWIDSNADRFVKCKLVISSVNTGVAPNINRGLRECSGEWIKVLGADDLFMSNAVSDVMSFATLEMDIIVSQYYPFIQNGNERILQEIHPTAKLDIFYKEKNAHIRQKLVLTNFIDATIGYFIRKSVLDKIGGYDEEYPMMEDVPMFLKLTYSGYRFHLLEKPCFLYRIAESITHPSNERVYSVRFKESSLKFHRNVTNKLIPWWNIIHHQSYWMAYIQFHLIVKFAHNRNNRLARFIKTVIYYLTIDSYVKMIKGY